MHLLAATPGAIADGSEAIDLQQSPGDIVILSAADTELACLSTARARIDQRSSSPAFPSVRLANLLHLNHPMSVDLYVENTLTFARLAIVRLLGGHGYWPYGVEQVTGLCRARGIRVAFLPGDDQPDAELTGFSTLPQNDCHRLWQYLVHGGIDNSVQFLNFAASLIGASTDWTEPRPLLRAGLYWPGRDQIALQDIQSQWRSNHPVAAVVFYRALVQAGNLAVIDALVDGLRTHGLNPLPIFVSSLKDLVAAATIARVFADSPPDIILNGTGFAVSVPGAETATSPFSDCDCPVLQVVFAGSNFESWQDGTHGLTARDIAMNVALPEVDGRIISRAVSFKGRARRDEITQTDIVAYEPVADRVDFVCRLAANWARLKRTPTAERRVALVLANYPNRDGRLGNGVGLDTPASAIEVLGALTNAGYRVEDIPVDGNALIARLAEGPTNDLRRRAQRTVQETISFAEYQIFFSGLDATLRDRILDRWGPPENDPFYQAGELDCGRFLISAFRCGNIAICLQPARGYNIDPTASYHDPDLPPPHGYLAFYAWVRQTFGAHAVVHLGKHGNLEWLPGKALALSAGCFPEAALGALPHLYPFIVNDPGEGTQAKRRAQAVIIDHLTPPLTRAESYGPLKDLEQLVDEYYEAAGVDPRRLKLLTRDILELSQSTGIDRECGIERSDPEADALAKLDRYLCELKELQIRDGLHIFGRPPEGTQLRDLLVALARVPRGRGDGGDASLIRALADDLGLGFDPLDGALETPWTGPRPPALTNGGDPWRTAGDTVERLEALAARLVDGTQVHESSWPRTRAVLEQIDTRLRPAVQHSGAAELAGLLTGLDGRFVPPGPSGAPTRGRPDVLPTGRNFYAVDTRTVPTPAAWTLGWKSAGLLIDRYVQDHGDWPRRLAISAWGTSNMRTGGDDIAQALALLGVRPTWDAASRRVTGFEILPLNILDRPRVDVTLRISGFFRDAFPNLIDLFDSAARAVAALEDESATNNPLAALVNEDRARLLANGEALEKASQLAGARVFGSKPGAYGAGLQALIDERGWQTDADLARAYVAWGGYAYGSGLKGQSAQSTFETRLKSTQAVIQNQDNREHDILDSDDYYQFEGGMTAAVRVLSGAQPAVYHADHARPETPKIRTLEEEVARVVRSRVVNPKWIQGVMRHGYKGGFEMAATVDYLFAFAATARCVSDHHFDAVYEAYISDDAVRAFLEANNAEALKEMSQRLLEAQNRNLWRPKSNSAQNVLEEIAEGDGRSS
ncbi:MAG: cobaltochelatase subunit CobN [Hyphomicrobiales bacterium]|nr:cobaltochelatase subunit CobN [Hyphomicrobiales bacterium]